MWPATIAARALLRTAPHACAFHRSDARATRDVFLDEARHPLLLRTASRQGMTVVRSTMITSARSSAYSLCATGDAVLRDLPRPSEAIANATSGTRFAHLFHEFQA